MKTKKHIIKSFLLVCLACYSLTVAADGQPFFTTDITINDKGELLMTQKGSKQIDVFSPDGQKKMRSFSLTETPTGILAGDGVIYVTTFESSGKLLILSAETGKTEASIPTGSGACYPMYSPDKKHIYVCNQFANTISEIDPVQQKVIRTANVLREPKSAVFSKDGKFLFVANYLPAQRADVDIVASCVSVIDMKNFAKIKDIQLASGSNALRGTCITPDGKLIYISHNLGRFTVPTSQLKQGWMNTSAFSIIDVEKQEYMGAVIVDDPERGAAGIWSISCNDESIFISHSGTHEVSIIDHKAMRRKFENYPDRSVLDYDLNFLHGMRKRIPLKGNGPRAMILTGDELIVPTYFADILNIININTHEVTDVNLNPERQETAENKGERMFNDAMKCFQNWQSCNGCHPGDARADAMNWDLMNDGVGNSKNCKSLLFSHVTPPNMISGIRASAEIAVDAGFRFIQFYELEKDSLEYVNAYLKALTPVPSPYLDHGTRTVTF